MKGSKGKTNPIKKGSLPKIKAGPSGQIKPMTGKSPGSTMSSAMGGLRTMPKSK